MRTGQLAVCRWAILAVALTLAACTTPAPKVVVLPAPEAQGEVVAGSLLWPDHEPLPQGAHAEVTLRSATLAGKHLLAQSDAPARNTPYAFGLWLKPGTLQPGEHYLLQARIVDATGHVLWTLPVPLPLSAASAASPLELSLQRPAAPPASGKQTPPSTAASDMREMFVALGERPSHWRAAVLGHGAQRQLRANLDDKAVERQYGDVTRKRLANGALIFTANHGWVSLILTPGACTLGGNHYSWQAMMEITGATFHGCARGMF